jgi:sulfhydrogenase subunit gamma (sulfur reductase)
LGLLTVAVRHVANATPRTRIIGLDLGDTPFPFSAGQAVMVGLHDSPLRKPYSIASAPWEFSKTGVLHLLAQVDETGALDPHLELAAPGTLIDLDGPFGSFGLPLGFAARPMLFVAGGTGIAPLRSILMERLSQPQVPAVSVVYSARSPEQFAYRTELDAMAQAGRIKLVLTVSRLGEGWDGRMGRIDERLLSAAIPSLDACCLICGPPQLVTDTTALLLQIGVSADQILTEKY